MKTISENEVLGALQAAMDDGRGDPNGITPNEAFELLRETGIPITINTVRRTFGKLVKEGSAKIVTVKRARWDGVMYTPRGIVLTGRSKK